MRVLGPVERVVRGQSIGQVIESEGILFTFCHPGTLHIDKPAASTTANACGQVAELY
jgi:hypothetical protein